MSHPAHIILKGSPDDDYSKGTVTIEWNVPAGVDHTEVGNRVKKMLNLEEKIYAVMESGGDGD
jgi:hypothetical protein